MELVLMECIWSMPCQVRAARSEPVNIGTITNAGGQPVNGHSAPAHAVGKSCMMKLVLTGRMWDDVDSVAAAQADVFQKNSDNKLNKIDKNMKIKR